MAAIRSVKCSDALREAVEWYQDLSLHMTSQIDEQEVNERTEARIRAKLEAGKKLSYREMQYLKKHNPTLYAYALRVEIKRKALEHRLEHAKSKSEVATIQLEAMSGIRKDDPAKKYIMAAVIETVKAFKETEYYKNLPETDEEAKKESCVKHTEFEQKAEDDEECGRTGEGFQVVYECGTGTGVSAYQIAYVAIQ